MFSYHKLNEGSHGLIMKILKVFNIYFLMFMLKLWLLFENIFWHTLPWLYFVTKIVYQPYRV
jgi:hypothetical protein